MTSHVFMLEWELSRSGGKMRRMVQRTIVVMLGVSAQLTSCGGDQVEEAFSDRRLSKGTMTKSSEVGKDDCCCLGKIGLSCGWRSAERVMSQPCF